MLVAPGVAAAQGPEPAPVQTPPPAAPAPAKATLALALEGVSPGRSPFAVAGERWRVRGSVSAFVPAQTVTVRLYLGGHRAKAVTVTVNPGANNTGQFVLGFSVKHTGRYRVAASHVGTPQQATMVAPPRHISIVSPRVGPGTRGATVRLLQRRLSALHYAVPRSGVFDEGTARAVLAYRKVSGLARTSEVGRRVFHRLLRGKGTFEVRYPAHGRHVEASLSKQVLAEIDPGGHVRRIYPISSGKPSTPTVLGSFRFYSKSPGTNAKGMFMSNYFIRGYAIHGYPDVPAYAASHGCLRIPNPDAVAVYEWIRIGDRIDVYR
jgi:peptidoglycan hydrolase-like protein with peptidoglycan-binding domain